MAKSTTAKPEKLKSYTFRVVLEEDAWPDDPNIAYHAYVPGLEALGAATWGHTREEALRHIQEVLAMVLEELIADGEPIPTQAIVADGPWVTVTLSR